MLSGDPKKEALCEKKTYSGVSIVTVMVDLGGINYVGAEVSAHTLERFIYR